jgi:hypothetical protein
VVVSPRDRLLQRDEGARAWSLNGAPAEDLETWVGESAIGSGDVRRHEKFPIADGLPF